MSSWNQLYAVGLLIALATALVFGDGIRVPYLATGIMLTLALVALLRSYRRPAAPLVRAQLRWIFWGSVLPILCTLAASVLTGENQWIFIQLTVATYVIFVLAIGIAVLRYHLYDIDVVIRRTLVYGILTVALALIYYGSVIVLQQVVRLLTGQLSDAAVVGSTLVIAALFNPLRRAVQGFIDRRFFRRKYDARQTLAAFGETVRDEVDLTSLTEQLLGVVDETLQPRVVSLWLRQEVSSPTAKHT